jgi:hypothetical protein
LTVWDDPAVALVSAYLRINGYFTLSGFAVDVRTAEELRALTDLDVIAVRLPSAATDMSLGDIESGLLTELDPALGIADDRIDVLFVEVKQGEIEFNPGMRRPGTLHAGLQRVGGRLGATAGAIVEQLVATGRFESVEAQVRLMAVGSHGHVGRGMSLTHAHLLDFVERHVTTNAATLRSMQLGDPIIAFLELIEKAKGHIPQ